MKILVDFFPIIIFFIAFKAYGIYIATIATIVANLQLIYLKFSKHKIENLHWISLALIVILGGATILLQDEWFIKWKPTAVNWVFALIFILSPWIIKKPIPQKLMEHAVELPNKIWRNLNYVWVAFFILSGSLNIYVAYNFSTNTWVNFKLFGMLGLTILFVIIQSFYMYKHIKQEKN